MVSMQSAHQVVEGGEGNSAFAELQVKTCHRVSDDAASDCSTVPDHEDIASQRNDESLSDCFSDSGLDVDTLIIFDWDDTLFPTSWLQKHGLLAAAATLNVEQETLLNETAQHVRLTLTDAVQLGKVVIVTNARQGWIEQSCTKFMPSLVSLLKTVDIVSARSTYEQSAQKPAEWKRLAFQHEVNLFYGSRHEGHQRNIVSLGDSFHELVALTSITKEMPNCHSKSIKLFEVPSVEQLLEQHELLRECLLDVVEHDGNLDVEIGAENLE